ncbi:TPA: hypothetical protein I8374_003095 [Serratia marcescens]|uniref:MrpH family fimbial adhesin n=1 Tax=Serratia TaxID=613 RepID=UPI000AC4D112|nr:hypothetical protein [Serratia marcescens]MBH3205818.1 hypothetical protein [Serratia marcescens]HAT2868625.1 hypothetical protein [Serratia marcescens]HAT2873857.1 hypothetical protein [Serratia marcescens]HAT2924511.1 hypothetical protein [Serratia marcescens]
MIKKIWLCCVLSVYSSLVYSAPYELQVEASESWRMDVLSITSWDINDQTFNLMRLQPEGEDKLYFIYYDGLGDVYYPPEYFHVPGARKAKTMGELGKLFISAGHLGKRIDGWRSSSAAWRSCWKFGYQYFNVSSWNVIAFSNTCTYGDYPQTTCWIDKPSIEIDHGTLTTKKVNGNSAYTEFYVSCSSAMSVYVVSPTKESSVVLSQANGLRSDIMINDRKLGDGARITASTSPTRVRVSSTLAGYNAQGTGTFTGSFTIILAKD